MSIFLTIREMFSMSETVKERAWAEMPRAAGTEPWEVSTFIWGECREENERQAAEIGRFLMIREAATSTKHKFQGADIILEIYKRKITRKKNSLPHFPPPFQGVQHWKASQKEGDSSPMLRTLILEMLLVVYPYCLSKQFVAKFHIGFLVAFIWFCNFLSYRGFREKTHGRFNVLGWKMCFKGDSVFVLYVYLRFTHNSAWL